MMLPANSDLGSGATMADHLMTIDKNTYESLQQELQELRQLVANRDKKSSQEQMGLFIEYTPAAIAVFDREMRYLQASRRWREDYGLGNEDIIGRSHSEICPEMAVFWGEIHQRCLHGKIEKCAEDAFSRADGTTDWVKWEICPWYENSGTVGGMVMFTEVITTRKQAEAELKRLNEELEGRIEERTKALQQSESRLQRLADNVPGMLYEFHLHADGTMFFPYVSSGCREITGREAKELLNDASATFADIHPEDISNVEAAIAHSAETLQNFECEWRITPSGQQKWIKAVSKPERRVGGKIVWYGCLLDITEQQIALRDRKQTEQQLQQQAQFLQSIWEGVDYGIFVLEVLADGEEFRYVKFNPAMLRISPMSLEPFFERTMAEALPQDIANHYRQRYRECIKSQKSIFFEEKFLADEEESWWLMNVTPLWDSHFCISQLVVTVTDITERKQAEKERQMFVSLIENSSDFIGLANLEAKPLFVNEAGRKLVGLDDLASTEDLTVADFFFPEDREYVQQQMMPTVIKDGLWQDEYRFRHFRTGEVIPVDYNVFSVKNPETGELLCIATITRDIRDRKNVEALLQEQEQFLRSIYEGVDQIIFVIDVLENCEFRYAAWNSTAEKATGISLANVIGKVPEDVHGIAEGAAIRQRYKNCVETGISSSYEECLTLRNQETWWLTKINPLKNSEGRIYRLVGTTLNITERKQAEIKLQQQAENLENTLRELQLTQTQLIHSEKMSSLGNMVAGVAHEINNPVNFIHGNLIPASEYAHDLLQLVQLYQIHFPYPPEEIKELLIDIDFDFLKEDIVKLLTSMRVGTQRIREIVLSLRNFSRLDEAEFKQVDIHEGIDSTLMILHNRLKVKPEHPEILVIKEYGKLPLIECYPGQLNQVFMNIISNAIDALEESFLGEQAQIYIRTEVMNNNWISISIADNGMGIDTEIVSKLFDPFFTTKNVGKGTGLGLSISYQIVVDRHRGKLSCHSEPGKGAEFVIEIPINQHENS
ncbi:PAS domain S-box protein [Anabaena sp. UHCC 0399]|nr:PAS domain S-box protein [Anabaena sp. UHCC 0399]MEA5569067.1 PAS domain S-box protein [Anabaena sp. UHCC 0399]